MRFAERTAEHGKILAIDIDQTAVDCAAAGNHAVAGDLLLSHAEIGAIMRHIGVEFFEAAFVEQYVEPFARGQAAFGMLRIDPLLPATQFRRRAARFQFSDIGRHVGSPEVPSGPFGCPK